MTVTAAGPRTTSSIASAVTLGALFDRNAELRPDEIALTELDGRKRRMTYGEAAAAVRTLIAQIEALRLPKPSAIALLLPNGTEFILSLLAAIKCGHVAVPLPVLWGKSDLSRALRECEAAMLITSAHALDGTLPALAAATASEIFELSFPCAFGESLPDGVLRLSLDGAAGAAEAVSRSPSAASIATVGAAADGIEIFLRHDAEWLAAGLGALIAADIRKDDTILSTVALTSAAVLSAAFVPWLLTGGTLGLAGTLPKNATAAASSRVHLLTPAKAAAAFCENLDCGLASCIAVHHDGGADAQDFSSLPCERIVDLHCFGEAGAIARRRSDPARAAPVPFGAVTAGTASSGAPEVAETALIDGKVCLRGAMVPDQAAAPGSWVHTGFTAASSTAHDFVPGPPEETIAIGGLRFGIADIERRILAAAPEARVAMIADPILGTRLAIWAEYPAQTARALLDAGLPRIIAQAVLQAERTRAAG